jgi:hypothetical protein
MTQFTLPAGSTLTKPKRVYCKSGELYNDGLLRFHTRLSAYQDAYAMAYCGGVVTDTVKQRQFFKAFYGLLLIEIVT